MTRRNGMAPLAGMIFVFGLGLLLVTPGISQGMQDGPTVAFRGKADILPAEASVVQGKTPDQIVEIVLPGRVYEPSITVVPVKRDDANWKTPEQASASDFSAFRAGDPEWVRENFLKEDYSGIKAMVEDANMLKLNQKTYMNYREKTILARCIYKDSALVFVRYDGVAEKGNIEVYQKVKREWKRTNALAQDETLAVLQVMFRQGSFEQNTR